MEKRLEAIVVLLTGILVHGELVVRQATCEAVVDYCEATCKTATEGWVCLVMRQQDEGLVCEEFKPVLITALLGGVK